MFVNNIIAHQRYCAVKKRAKNRLDKEYRKTAKYYHTVTYCRISVSAGIWVKKWHDTFFRLN
jgi:hypothetical protein